MELGNITPTKLSLAIDDNPVAATGTLTSDNTNVSDGDTVVIGTQTYTFKTALTSGNADPGEVLIGADADGSLTNLIAAINGTGTPGTDYDSSTPVNTDVTAGTVSAHAFTVTAKTAGYAGNAIASTEESTHLSWGGTTLSGGGSTIGTATVGKAGGRLHRISVVCPQLAGTPTYTVAITDVNGNQLYLSGNQNENATTNTALDFMLSPEDIIKVTTSTKVEETLPLTVLLR